MLEYNATITERKDLAEGLAIFRVEFDEELFDTFIPGQYAILGLNHPEKGPVRRPYSIASPPQDLPKSMDFYVRYVRQPTSDNPLTHLMFDCLANDRIFVAPKIRGKFTLNDELEADDQRLRVCVAAGTGLAPFTSMIFDQSHRTGSVENFIALHGVRYPRDLGYREEMEELLNKGKDKPGYFPTVSRPEESGEAWSPEAFKGRVETLFDPESLDRWETESVLGKGGLTPENAVIFICGLTGTIGGVLTRALERGFIPAEKKSRRLLGIPKDVKPSLFFEQYDTEPVINEEDTALIERCKQTLRGHGVEVE